MKSFSGKALRWEWQDGIVELTLDREPANEIGTVLLGELEQFVAAMKSFESNTAACIISSAQKRGFSAGADLRELYHGSIALPEKERNAGVRRFVEKSHEIANAIDAAPFVTIAAVHGVCFGGGLELALTCDIIIADKMARFAFPELRLGLIPGFGGIPRLKRDLGNAFVRDLLLTGRSVNAARAQAVGLVAQLAGEGEALKVARATAAQTAKFDATTRAAAKKFIKPIPHAELKQEVELFCELFARPTVLAALKKFVESTDAMPYLP
ncbi:MAG TPA: enoyl-CoA hydratase/isomerase family protein [Candidatus Dormibacteraeota bacterium]|jgi:enoyl-CoA hydratase|nr:enoyl-CoA hydratase/isomerase family protein [Candidatus Dormibacteraeota bacterium]